MGVEPCKRTKCISNDIKLFEIDVSQDTNFEKTKNNRWDEVRSIINLNLLQIKDLNL